MASNCMAKRTEMRSRTRLPLVILGAAAASMPMWVSQRGDLAYTAPQPNGKPSRGSIHNKNNLPKNPLEIPLEVPEPPPAPKPTMPEKRVPYTLNIESQLPHHTHLKDDSNGRKVIEAKLNSALAHFAESIRHVEVHLHVSEGFHKDQPGAGKVVVTKEDPEDEEELPKTKVKVDAGAGRLLAPYFFTATVSLRDHTTVVLSNPEKHAQTSLTAAIDHMCDVLSKSLREKKEKYLQQRKKEARKISIAEDDDDFVEEAIEAAEALAAEKDAKDEAMYAEVEAAFNK